MTWYIYVSPKTGDVEAQQAKAKKAKVFVRVSQSSCKVSVVRGDETLVFGSADEAAEEIIKAFEPLVGREKAAKVVELARQIQRLCLERVRK